MIFKNLWNKCSKLFKQTHKKQVLFIFFNFYEQSGDFYPIIGTKWHQRAGSGYQCCCISGIIVVT